MDTTDHQILQILQKKARVPNIEVARKIGMAPSAVLERIKKLETKGIIQGYEARLNPDMFNCSLIAFIQIKLNDSSMLFETGKTLSKIDQAQEVHYLAGEDCLMIKLRVSDNIQLEKILRTRITSINAVKTIKTLIALATYKESAKIMLPKT